MTHHLSRPRSLPARLVMAVVGLSVWAQPAAATTPDPQGVFRYELHALGTTAGEAVLTIGERKNVGQRGARSVRVEARTASLAGRVYKAIGDGTAIVDDRHLPTHVKWAANAKGSERSARVKIGRRGIAGHYRRDGKPNESIDFETESWPLDAISAYIWIPQQDLTPGRTYAYPFFDGRRLGDLQVSVGVARAIHLPVGLREAVPVHLTVKRAKKTRKVTFWIGPEDRVLYRVEVPFGILNRVRADLVGMRRARLASGR